MSKLNIFVPITKVDAKKGIVYGVLAAEETDHSNEVFDYAGSKPYFEKWSAGIAKATDGKSLGNLRAMHGTVAAGKFTSMTFNDAEKRIEVAAKIVDKDELEKAIEGVYTGFSIGGKYVSRKKDGDVHRYVADPYEGSLVDLPCIPSATFEVIKADGAKLQKKFNPVGEVEAKAREICKAAGVDEDAALVDDAIGQTFEKGWMRYENDAIDALAKAVDEPVVEAAAPAAGAAPTNDQVAEKARALAKVAGDETKWLDHIEAARKALTAAPAATAKPAPVLEAKPAPVAKVAITPAATEQPAPAAGATASDDGTEAQVWVHKRLPGKTFAKKGEMRQALIDLDATEAAAKVANPITEQLEGLRDALDAKDPTVKKAVFVEIAETANETTDGALQKMSGLTPVEWDAAGAFAQANPNHDAVKALGTVEVMLAEDGTPKDMPAATKAALKALSDASKGIAPAKTDPAPAQTVDLSKTTDKASFLAAVKSLDPKKPLGFALRREIAKQARGYDAVADLPKEFGMAPAEPVDLKKIATGDLKKSASLYSIGSLIQLLAQVDSCEENLESPGYGYGTQVPKALCDRFGSVLVEMGDIVAEVLDVVLAEMRTEEANEAGGNVMRMAKALAHFSQVVVDQPLVKAGARHSRADTSMINEVHTLAVGLGADCGSDEDEDAAKVAVGDLQKALDARDAAFGKTMGEVATLVKDIAARVKNIEAQPLPEGTTSYRVVEKGREPPVVNGGGTEGYGGQLQANAEVFAELSRLLIKTSHGAPRVGSPGYYPRD